MQHFKRAAPLCMLIFSALPHQTDVKLHGTANGLDADAFVVAMQGAALLGGQIHGRETVHMVADTAIVAAVGALHHQVGGDEAAFPGACHSAGDLVPGRAVRLADTARVHAFQLRDLDGGVVDGLFQVGKSTVHRVLGVQAQVADERCLGRDDVAALTALGLGKGHRRAHQGV